MNESQQSSKHTNKKKTETFETEKLRRHRALAWNVHFSVQKVKKEEGGVLTQLSYFIFNGKHGIIEIAPPSFVPVFPVEKKNHFYISSKWPADVIELLVIVIQLVWGSS